jgi:L-cysteine desulfidase
MFFAYIYFLKLILEINFASIRYIRNNIHLANNLSTPLKVMS